MTRHKEIPQRDVAAIEAKLRAADVPVRATRVGKAIAAKIPQTWDGQGDPPIGWTRHWDVRTDPDTGDALFQASPELVQRVPELEGATEEVPEKWRRAPEEKEGEDLRSPGERSMPSRRGA